jgi:DNA-dependent RNA polymerase auxiliary subunit epsilon
MKKLVVEYKKGFQPSNDTFKAGNAVIMITPDLNEDYWIMRVKLHKDQSLVAFPKFGLIGIGFAQESDWNTNLPYQVEAERLYVHIRKNKKYRSISKATCLEGIKLLQEACANYEKEKKAEADKTINLNMRDVDNIIMGAICTSGIRRVKRSFSRN